MMGGMTTQDTEHRQHRHQEQRGWHNRQQQGQGDNKAEDEGMTMAAARMMRGKGNDRETMVTTTQNR
jgi:hypothetical protein